MTTNYKTVVFPSTYIDAFGRQRVSQPSTIFDSKMLVDNAPSFWDDQQTSGAGTSSTYNTNQASVTMAVSAAVAGTRVRQTFRQFSYQPGKSQLIFQTGILGVPATGIRRRIGQFNASNGIFFESDPTRISVVIRSSTSGAPVPTAVQQANWNMDTMDGNGPSGVNLDFSKTQIFFFDYEWLGVGGVRMGFVVNDQLIYCHQFNNTNVLTTVYMSLPNLPLRYEISSDGTNAAGSITQICSTVISEGGSQQTGFTRSADRGATSLTTLNDPNLYPLVAMRLKSAYLSSFVLPKNISIICTSTAAFRWALLLNPTVTGVALAFADIPNSAVQVDVTKTSATTVSGGVQVASGYQLATTDATLDVALDSDLSLGSNIAGVSDILVLAVQRVTGTTETFFGGITWNETE